MALNLKTNPVGIDFEIDKIQQALYVDLIANLGWTNYECYSRCYRNKKSENIFPETYLSSGEYKEVLFDDRFNVTSFFLVDEEKTQKENSQFEQNISIIFQANLKNLYPDISHRADEEMQMDIYQSIKNIFYDTFLEKIISGVDNVYRSLEIKTDKKYLDDMSYFHICRFDFKLIFNLDRC